MKCKLCKKHITKKIYEREYCNKCVSKYKDDIYAFHAQMFIMLGRRVIPYEETGAYLDWIIEERRKNLN